MTKKLIRQAILKLEIEIAELQDERNPQIKQLVIQMKPRKEVFEAVLASLNNDHSLLKSYI